MGKAVVKPALTAFGEVLGLFGVPGFGTAMEIASAIREKAINDGFEILLERLRLGGVGPLPNERVPDAVAMMLRYHEAAKIGAATQNLRLLADLMSGGFKFDNFKTDDFLAWADRIATLDKRELVAISEIHRFTQRRNRDEVTISDVPDEWGKMVRSLIPRPFPTEDHFKAIAQSASRSGLIARGELLKDMTTWLATPLLDELLDIANRKELVDRAG